MTGSIVGFLLWWGSLDVAASLLCLVRLPYDKQDAVVKPIDYLSCWLSFLPFLVLHLWDYYKPSISNPIVKRTISSTIPLNFLAIAKMCIKRDRGEMEGLSLTSMVAVLLFTVPGAAAVAQTSYLFFTQGEGTPSPAPKSLVTQLLVIEGPYQYTRNPMVSGKAWFLIGVSLLFHSTRVLLFDVAFVLIGTAFFIYYEEPELRSRFGKEYVVFCQNVPRWIPRLSPYHGDTQNKSK